MTDVGPPVDADSSTVVFCVVLPKNNIYIGASRDIAESFERFRRNWDHPFLPVAAYECDPVVFTSVTSLATDARYSLGWGAAVFRNIGVADGAAKAFQRHLAVGEGLPGLFADWVQAVNS